MDIVIPGRDTLTVEHVAMDYNGTIAVDGLLIPEVAARIEQLAHFVDVHVLTADTFGTVAEQCAGLDVTVDVFPSGDAAHGKLDVVTRLGSGTCCIGNGYNDRLMFEQADLAIAIIEHEGACAQLLACADVVVTHAEDALDLLLKPDRLVATLRG